MHRHTANRFQQIAQWKEKPIILHQKAGCQTSGANGEFTNYKIPIAGMWSYTNHAFRGFGNVDLEIPSKLVQQKTSKFHFIRIS